MKAAGGAFQASPPPIPEGINNPAQAWPSRGTRATGLAWEVASKALYPESGCIKPSRMPRTSADTQNPEPKPGVHGSSFNVQESTIRSGWPEEPRPHALGTRPLVWPIDTPRVAHAACNRLAVRYSISRYVRAEPPGLQVASSALAKHPAALAVPK